MKILKGIAHYYEQYHGVKIPDGVLRQAVLLSGAISQTGSFRTRPST